MKQIFIIVILISIFSGCATKEPIKSSPTQIKPIDTNNPSDDLASFDDEFATPKKEQSDPLKGYNVVMTNFNDKFYTYIFNPVAKGYKKVVPDDARQSIRNFFHNLMYPIRLINNVLQGKFKNASEETGRFVVNTTVGIFGLFDPAKKYLDWQPHEEDFGQTLGYYGVGAGPHIVLPILGPSNLRDMLSMYPDSLSDPVDYHHDRSFNLTDSGTQSVKLKVFKETNEQSYRAEQYEDLKKDAVQLYPFLKDIYEQHRDKLIKE